LWPFRLVCVFAVATASGGSNVVELLLSAFEVVVDVETFDEEDEELIL